MRIKSTPRKTCMTLAPYAISKKATFGATVVKEAPSRVTMRSCVELAPTPDTILDAVPTGLMVSPMALKSGGLGLSIALAKTTSETAFFTFLNGKDDRQVVNVRMVDRATLVDALEIVGVSAKAFETYERMAKADMQDLR